MEEKIKDLLKGPIEEAGYILDEVFYGKEDNINTLRLVIDKAGYINVGDCVKVNEIVNPIQIISKNLVASDNFPYDRLYFYTFTISRYNFVTGKIHVCLVSTEYYLFCYWSRLLAHSRV